MLSVGVEPQCRLRFLLLPLFPGSSGPTHHHRYHYQSLCYHYYLVILSHHHPYHYHTWYLSPAPPAVLVEKKSVTWRNFPHNRLSCGENLHMTDCHVENYLHMVNVEKSIQWGNFPHEKCGHKSVLSQFSFVICKIWFVTIYAVLSWNLFCCDLRSFVWRKIEPKIVLVEKKRQISGMLKCHKSLRWSFIIVKIVKTLKNIKKNSKIFKHNQNCQEIKNCHKNCSKLSKLSKLSKIVKILIT